MKIKLNSNTIGWLLVVALFVSVGAVAGSQIPKLLYEPRAIPIANNLGARPDGIAQYSLTNFDKSDNYVTCSDTGGCYLWILETGSPNGLTLRIHNVSANNVTIKEASGVREMSGDQVLGQYDNIEFQYVVNHWEETNEHNN